MHSALHVCVSWEAVEELQKSMEHILDPLGVSKTLTQILNVKEHLCKCILNRISDVPKKTTNVINVLCWFVIS